MLDPPPVQAPDIPDIPDIPGDRAIRNGTRYNRGAGDIGVAAGCFAENCGSQERSKNEPEHDMSTKHSTKSVRSATNKRAAPSQPPRPVSGPWNRHLEELAAFKKEHGHCRVPVAFKACPSLARWVVAQRYARRKGRLSAERIRRLDKLGFAWDVMKQERWEAKYEALAAYRRAHGHCRVPVATGECPSLAHWVSMQRHSRRAGTLSTERIRRLDKLDFVWDGWEEQWERMFAALVRYKESHGNCDVPRGWRRNPKLADWAARQRKFNRRGTLSPDRKKRLEALGFGAQEAVDKSRAKSRPSSQTTFGPIGGSRRMVVVGAFTLGR
jgi:hypothetical protein